MSNLIDADEIELYAINTGELYRAHLALAHNSATIKEWSDHIKQYVMPRYRREIDADAIARHSQVAKAAASMRDYYAQHILEG